MIKIRAHASAPQHSGIRNYVILSALNILYVVLQCIAKFQLQWELLVRILMSVFGNNNVLHSKVNNEIRRDYSKVNSGFIK